MAPAVLDFEWGDLSLQMTPDLPGGAVLLDLGPVGELSWRVHSAPINLEASFLLESRISRLPEPSDLANLPLRFLVRKLPWLLITGALTGALVAGAWGRRPHLGAAIGAGSALAVVLLLIVGAALTFRPAGLEDPRYRGPVEDVPRVLQIVRTATQDFEDVQKNIARMVAGLQRIQAQIGTTPTAEASEDAVRILAISDIQNNPVGLLIGQELVRRFEVDGVIDAGDFTDQGTDLEGELFARFADMQVPYVIAAGNHEDEAALNKVSENPNITVLDGEAGRDAVEIAGLQILGDRDPMSDEVISDPDTEKSKREIPIRCERLAERFEEIRPSILIVHRKEMGDCAAERAVELRSPLVFIWGHSHKQAYEERPYLVSGSPGTSGANGVKTPKETPYGFSLLEFDRSSRLLASTCQFQFDGPSALRQASCHLSPGYAPAQEAS